jgi:hypothetical protein
MKGKRKIAIAFCIAVPVVAICGLVLWGRFGSRPPAFDVNSPQKTVEYLASEKFVRMSMENKRRYLNEIRQSYGKAPMLTFFYDPKISEPLRQKLIANVLPVIGPIVSQRLDEFESLPPGEQTARLDAIIDQMVRFDKENGGRMFSLQRLGLILQYVDPYTRARLRKHIPELTRRMVERGILFIK